MLPEISYKKISLDQSGLLMLWKGLGMKLGELSPRDKAWPCRRATQAGEAADRQGLRAEAGMSGGGDNNVHTDQYYRGQ